jgi:hypothetical protein
VIDFLHSTVLFHTLAALTLMSVAAVQACRPAPRRARSLLTGTAPQLMPLTKPDAANQDFAESYDEAA